MFHCQRCYDVLKKDYGLNCGYDCDYDVAKKNLHQLYLQHHPDKGGDPAKFIEVTECGKVVVTGECMKNRRTKGCMLDMQPIAHAGYKVDSNCIKAPRDKVYDPKCKKGLYYRQGYKVKEKCGPFAGEGLQGLEKEYAELLYADAFTKKVNKQFEDFIRIDLGIRKKSHPDDVNSRFKKFDNGVNRKISTKLPPKNKFKELFYWFYEVANRKNIDFHGRYHWMNTFYQKHGYYYKLVPEKSPKVSKPCLGGETNRSTKTGKCMKPCKQTQARNPVTNRCNKLPVKPIYIVSSII